MKAKSNPACKTLSFLILLFWSCVVSAQTENRFTFNADNGLPSNHVYTSTVDRNGYLWIGTPNGVVRYNGYEFKIFNVASGLPKNDVWQLYEDKKGRMWVVSISDQLGYIYKDVFHKAYLKNINHTIYPQGFSEYSDGILFHTPFLRKDNQTSICVEFKDTIYQVDAFEHFSNRSDDTTPWRPQLYAFINRLGGVTFIYKGIVYNGMIKDREFVIKDQFVISDTALYDDFHYSYWAVFDSCIAFSRKPKSKTVAVLNFKNGIVDSVNIDTICKNENIVHIYRTGVKNGVARLCVKTYTKLLEFDVDHGVRLISSTDIKDISRRENLRKDYFCTIFNSGIWGNVVNSDTSGMTVVYNSDNHFKKMPPLINPQCSYLGGRKDKINFWWDHSTFSIISIDSSMNTRVYKCPVTTRLYSLIPYSNDTFLVAGYFNYWFKIKTGELIKIPNLFGVYGASNAIFVDSTASFMLASLTGIFHLTLDKKLDVRFDNIDYDRYNGMVFDSLTGNYWAYNESKVLIYNRNRKTKRMIQRDGLKSLGVNMVEKILVDNKYDNIFIKGSDNIVMLGPQEKPQAILSNINNVESTIFIDKDILIVAGPFGVNFCRISGQSTISSSIQYKNVKFSNYRRLYGAQVAGGKILLNTDKGVYEVKIPSDREFKDVLSQPINREQNFILRYDTNVVNAEFGDTFQISQANSRLFCDIINPYGNGKIKYAYKMDRDSVWLDLNANELALPHLVPGKYYKLLLRATDDVWRSDPLDVYIYIIPFWWQTLFQNRWFWVGVAIFFGGFIYIIVFITRKIVMKSNLKRNMRLELELKSVYSQINPHFIFNTLTTALFFIKKNRMEEAYDHVSKFSRLLRAYIKSSRNKYISLKTEIENLDAYIQLQQVRFEDKFDYQMVVDANIDIARINIPALLLQPIVENAIDHGLFHKQGNGHLKIEFQKTHSPNQLRCVIDDDGIGREQAKILSKQSVVKSESYGESLIQDLVAIFNKYEKMNISIEYKDKQLPQTGTTVIINIKNPIYDK